jgi:hypothetical protein
MCWVNPSYAPKLYTVIGTVDSMPDLGWVTLMVGLIYVYLACKPDARPYSLPPHRRQNRANPG